MSSSGDNISDNDSDVNDNNNDNDIDNDNNNVVDDNNDVDNGSNPRNLHCSICRGAEGGDSTLQSLNHYFFVKLNRIHWIHIIFLDPDPYPK